MSLLDSIFSGAKAFVRELVSVAAEAVKVVLKEVDRSAFGKAVTGLIQGAARRYFSTATDLAEEERELAEKRRRDGRYSQEDLDRLHAIEKERDRLRKEMDDARAQRATEDLRAAQDEVVAAVVTDDEASSSVGILSTKVCPECGGAMRIRQGGVDDKTGRRRFYWQCTLANAIPCPTIKLDPQAEPASVIRRPDADLDASKGEREATWNHPDVLVKTHGRLRGALGEDDEEIVCPKHLLPMKLMQKAATRGRMLESYEYICVGINANGWACDHTVPVLNFPQVAAALRRREGRGIIDG